MAHCTFEECQLKYRAKGYCHYHYDQHIKGRTLRPYRDPRVHPDTCYVLDCDRPYYAKGLCLAHDTQRRRGKKLTIVKPRTLPIGSVRNNSGYLIEKCPGHPNAHKSGWVLQHIKVMSETLGRPLLREENVHHINGVKDDNRPENLELWSVSQPPGQRVRDKLEWAYQLIQQYEGIEV